MVNDEEEDYDIYKVMPEKQLDKKKIVLFVLIAVVLIELIMVALKSIEIINQHKVYQEYETQMIVLKEEEDRQAKIEEEKERIRQEKIPKLTQQRKNKHGKYISFRIEKGISYL